MEDARLDELKAHLKAMLRGNLRYPGMYGEGYLALISVWHTLHNTPDDVVHAYPSLVAFLMKNDLGPCGISNGVRQREIPNADWYSQDVRIGQRIHEFLLTQGIDIDYEPVPRNPKPHWSDGPPDTQQRRLKLGGCSQGHVGSQGHEIVATLHDARNPGAHWWTFGLEPAPISTAHDGDHGFAVGAQRLARELRRIAARIDQEVGTEELEQLEGPEVTDA